MVQINSAKSLSEIREISSSNVFFCIIHSGRSSYLAFLFLSARGVLPVGGVVLRLDALAGALIIIIIIINSLLLSNDIEIQCSQSRYRDDKQIAIQ